MRGCTLFVIYLYANIIDDLFSFYSGHGDDGGLSPYDTLYYSYSDLDTKFDMINSSNTIILIDACRSGSIIPAFSRDNLYILTASRSEEDAIETSEFTNGVFSHYFLDSYSKANDENLDNIISLEEQYPKILSTISSYSGTYGLDQHPVEFDNIPGPTTLIPSLSDITITRNQKTIVYSFNLEGSGHIYASNLTLSDNNEEITYDISNSTISTTGFGEYSGKILWEQNPREISGQLKIIIKGEHIRTLTFTFSLVSSSNNISMGNVFLFSMIIALASIIIIKKERKNL